MTRKTRIQVGAGRKRRLKILVVVLLLSVGITWLSVNHDLLIPYLISTPSKTVESNENSPFLRGTLYDRTYKELAVSLERVSVYALPREVGSLDETANRLAPVLGRSKNELLLKLNNDAVRVWLARDVSQETEVKIRNLKLPGVFLGKEIVRHYPQQQSMAHLLGYTDKNRGLAGIEWHYNDLLENYGAHPDKVGESVGSEATGLEKTGVHLVLTFDVKIQKKLEEAIKRLAAHSNTTQIAACVMEMSSGALVASGHYPSFEPNRFSEYHKRSLENILLQPIAVPENIRRLFKDASLIRNQFEKNVRMLPWSLVSEEVALGSQIRFWEDLSLSSSLQLDFAKDDAGSLEKRPLLPIGPLLDFGAVPEVATPFQLLTGITRLLNDGKKIVPYVLDRVIDRKTEKESPFPREISSHESSMFSLGFSTEMRKLLAAQTNTGPFDSRSLAGEMLAETGVNHGYQYVKNRIRFVYFPSDKSDLIFLFVLKEIPNYPEKPLSARYAIQKEVNRVIAPIVALQEVTVSSRDVMEVEDKEEINYQLLNIGRAVVEDTPPTTRIRISSGESSMPDLVGLSLRKSLQLLQKKNVKIRVEGYGRVVKQEPAAGASLEKRKTCRLILKTAYSISQLTNRPAVR